MAVQSIYIVGRIIHDKLKFSRAFLYFKNKHFILYFFLHFAFKSVELNALNLHSTLRIPKNKYIDLISREDCEYALQEYALQ